MLPTSPLSVSPIVQKMWNPRRLTNPMGLHGLLGGQIFQSNTKIVVK
jgi:hypothetical protein